MSSYRSSPDSIGEEVTPVRRRYYIGAAAGALLVLAGLYAALWGQHVPTQRIEDAGVNVTPEILMDSLKDRHNAYLFALVAVPGGMAICILCLTALGRARARLDAVLEEGPSTPPPLPRLPRDDAAPGGE